MIQSSLSAVGGETFAIDDRWASIRGGVARIVVLVADLALRNEKGRAFAPHVELAPPAADERASEELHLMQLSAPFEPRTSALHCSTGQVQTEGCGNNPRCMK